MVELQLTAMSKRQCKDSVTMTVKMSKRHYLNACIIPNQSRFQPPFEGVYSEEYLHRAHWNVCIQNTISRE